MWVTVQERAALTGLGLAALLGLSVLVWQRQKPPLVIGGAVNPVEAAQWDGALAAARQIDINAAGVAALERLPGVGPTLARRIVEYRDAHGPFGASEDLSRVKGIGSKTFSSLQDYVTTHER